MTEEAFDSEMVPDPLFESDHDSSSGYSASPEPDSEEAIFTLLFQECDTDGSGYANVESLVGFIRKTQLGEQHQSDKEEVYDSQQDVPGMQYNLHVLKAMLDCNAEDGKVDKATYSHVIKKWVKDLRSNQSALEESVLEVSQLSDSPDAEGEEQKNWSYGSYGTHIGQSAESFNTSGGHSSHPELDRIELMNSVADLKLENKRLYDRNHQLQIQMENSEENLKEIQGENAQLKVQIKIAQANLTRLEQLEGENTELATLVEEGRVQCQQLTEDIDKLDLQVVELKQELEEVKVQSTNVETDYQQLNEENRALQAMLMKKQELLSSQEVKHSELEEQLHGYKQQTEELSETIANMTTANEELKTENIELQTQLKKSSVKRSQPLSSTPYRPNAPSWHEELIGQENGRSPILPPREEGVENRPVVGGVEEELESSHNNSSADRSSINSESFSKILEETNHKINEKHSLIVRELSDLIAHSSPAPPSKRSCESSHMLISDKLNDKSFQSFESKLAELLRKKKQLQNENSRLSSQVADLTRRLQMVEREKNQAGSSETTDSALSSQEKVDISNSGTQTDQREDKRAVRFLDFGSQTELDDSQSPAAPAPARPSPKLALSLVAQHDVDGSECSPPPETEELAYQQAFENAMRHAGSEELDELKKKQHSISQQYDQLQERAQYIEKNQQDKWLSSFYASSYRILKGVALLLLITVLVLFLLSSLVVLQDAFDSCGSYCPHSPVQFLFSNLEPYLQYTRTAAPL